MSNAIQQGKINHASCLIVEDHLKKVLARTGTKGWKSHENKLLPRSQHSAFGDFPRTHMPKKASPVEAVQPLNANEQSAAASQIRKYPRLLGVSSRLQPAPVPSTLASILETPASVCLNQRITRASNGDSSGSAFREIGPATAASRVKACWQRLERRAGTLRRNCEC